VCSFLFIIFLLKDDPAGTRERPQNWGGKAVQNRRSSANARAAEKEPPSREQGFGGRFRPQSSSADAGKRSGRGKAPPLTGALPVQPTARMTPQASRFPALPAGWVR